jgi:hypothetical protein
MPRIQFSDDETYGKALYLLHYRVGGMFQTRPPRILLVGQGQYEALVQAGLIQLETVKESRRAAAARRRRVGDFDPR